MRIFLFIFFFIIVFTSVIHANDLLVLKNEMIFEGKVKKIERNSLRFKTISGSYWIPSSDIYYVKLDKPEYGILRDFFKKIDQSLSEKDKNEEESTETLIYKGYGIIGNDSYLKDISLLTPQDDDPQHRSITENYFQLGSKTFNDPINLRMYDQKAKLHFARNTGIAVGSILLLGILENIFFVKN